MLYLCARTSPDRYGLPFVITLSLLASERDTIRGVQIRAGAVYIYICMEVRMT